MRLGLVINNNGAPALDAVKRMSREAEALGYDSLWVTDHVIGVKSFKPVYGATWMEPLTSLAWIAAATEKIRLGIGVLVVPYRDPVYTAKVIATIDQLSDGRVDLGVGTGWAKSEYHALGRGAIFDQRGAVTDESLDVMLRCWEGGEFGWDGQFFQFRNIQFDPVPVQRPRVPLWIGSRTGQKAPMRRVAKYADVWHPTGLSPEELRQTGKELDDMAGRAIRRSVRLSHTQAATTDDWISLLGAYRDAGVDEAAIDFGGLDEALAEPGAIDRALDAARGLAERRGEIG
jgi:probable F420-dependent oxidoreductase